MNSLVIKTANEVSIIIIPMLQMRRLKLGNMHSEEYS